MLRLENVLGSILLSFYDKKRLTFSFKFDLKWGKQYLPNSLNFILEKVMVYSIDLVMLDFNYIPKIAMDRDAIYWVWLNMSGFALTEGASERC